MIRVLIVDDQRVLREGLRALIEAESDLQLVGTAENGQVAIEAVSVLNPDIILMDLVMPLMDGLAATAYIRQHHPDCRVLILSACDDAQTIQQALQSGAKGFLLKDTSSKQMLSAIRSVFQGDRQFWRETATARPLPSTVNFMLSTRATSNVPTFDPFHSQTLVKLTEVEELNGLLDECNGLSTKLKPLQEGFERIHQILRQV
jgi:DNA-binding NarL/FixJ family response regulator